MTKFTISDDFPKRPKMNIKIFDIGGNPNLWSSVCNDNIYGNPWDGYALAYKDAGQLLASKIKQDDFTYNTFGYPIFFIFRHYLELRLKEILLSGMILLDQVPSYIKNGDRTIPNIWDDELKSHNLLELWKKCVEQLKKIDRWEKYEDLDMDTIKTYRTIEFYIAQLSHDDMNSEAFRYPVDSNGQLLLKNPNVQTLNVSALTEVMIWISEILEGVSSGIDEARKIKAEYRAEHRVDYEAI